MYFLFYPNLFLVIVLCYYLVGQEKRKVYCHLFTTLVSCSQSQVNTAHYFRRSCCAVMLLILFI